MSGAHTFGQNARTLPEGVSRWAFPTLSRPAHLDRTSTARRAHVDPPYELAEYPYTSLTDKTP